MIPVVFLALLSTLCGVQLVFGGVILGDPQYGVIAPNFTDSSATQYNAASLDVLFTDSDNSLSFQITNATHTLYYVVLTEPELYSYTATAEKFGPEDIFIYLMRACAIDAYAEVNLTNVVYEPTPNSLYGESGSSSRRLFSARYGWRTDEVLDKRVRRYVSNIRRANRGLLQSTGTTQSADAASGAYSDVTTDVTWQDVSSCAGIIASVGLGISVGGITGIGSNCGALNAAVSQPINAAEARAASALAADQQIWNNDISTLTVGATTLSAQIALSLAQVTKALSITNQTAVQFKAALQAQSKVIDANFATAQTDIRTLGLQTAAAAVAQQQLVDQQLAAVQANFLNTTQNLVAQIDSTIALINSNQYRTDSNIRSVAQSLRQFQAEILKGIAGTNIYIDQDQLGQIWAAMDDALAKGRRVMLDPADPGTSPMNPNLIGPDDITAFVDLILINFVNITNGVPIVHQFGLNFYVNLPQLIQSNLMFGSWQDIQDLIGPANCTLNVSPGGNPVNYCQGWFQVTHTYCTRVGTFTWESISTLSDRSAYVLGPDICGEQPTTDPIWNGQYFDTVAELHDFIGDVCWSGSLVAGTNFQVVSTRIGVILVPPNYSSAVCSLDTDALFIDGTITTNTIPYTLYRTWITDLAAMQPDRDAFTAKVAGTRARGFTNIYEPFYGLSNGHSYSCYRNLISVFMPETQIYYRMTPVGVTPRVSINVYDQEPLTDCGTIEAPLSPCVLVPQGNLLRTEQPTSIQINTLNPQSGGLFDPNILPDDETIIFGELSPGTMDSVFDIPYTLLNLAPNARSRVGHPDYIVWPIPDDYSVAGTQSGGPPVADLPTWEADNPGETYDHSAPTSPSFYEHAVATSDGVCIPVDGVPFNKICDMLQNFVIDPSTNMRQGHLVVAPRQYTMIVSFNAIAGEVEVRVEAGCPEIAYDPNNILGPALVLTNSLPFAIAVLVTRTNTDDACPTGDWTATITAKWTQSFIFPDCGNYSAQVYSVQVGQGNPLLCGAPVEAAVQGATQVSLTLSNLVNTTTLAVTDALSVGLANSQLQLISLILNVVSSVVPSIPLSIGGVNFAALETNSSFDAYVSQLVATSNGVDLTSNTATGAIAPYISAINSLQAQLSVVTAVLIASNLNVTELVALQEAREANLTKVLANLNVASDNYIAINNQLADQSASSGWGSNRGCATLGFFDEIICYIEEAITIFVIGAVILGCCYAFYVIAQFLWQNRDAFKRNKPDQPPQPNPAKYDRVGGRANDYVANPSVVTI